MRKQMNCASPWMSIFLGQMRFFGIALSPGSEPKPQQSRLQGCLRPIANCSSLSCKCRRQRRAIGLSGPPCYGTDSGTELLSPKCLEDKHRIGPIATSSVLARTTSSPGRRRVGCSHLPSAQPPYRGAVLWGSDRYDQRSFREKPNEDTPG